MVWCGIYFIYFQIAFVQHNTLEMPQIQQLLIH